MVQRLNFLLNSERGLWYDGRCSWFENFESALHFWIESESSGSNSNKISKLRRSLRICVYFRMYILNDVILKLLMHLMYLTRPFDFVLGANVVSG